MLAARDAPTSMVTQEFTLDVSAAFVWFSISSQAKSSDNANEAATTNGITLTGVFPVNFNAGEIKLKYEYNGNGFDTYILSVNQGSGYEGYVQVYNGLSNYDINYRVALATNTPNSAPPPGTTAAPGTTLAPAAFQQSFSDRYKQNRPLRYSAEMETRVLQTRSISANEKLAFLTADYDTMVYIGQPPIGYPPIPASFLNIFLNNTNVTINLSAAAGFFSTLKSYLSFIPAGSIVGGDYITMLNPNVNTSYNLRLETVIKVLATSSIPYPELKDLLTDANSYVMFPLIQNNSLQADFLVTVPNDANNLNKLQVNFNTFGTFLIRDQHPYYYALQRGQQFSHAYATGVGPLTFYYLQSDGFPLISSESPAVICLLKGTNVLTPSGYIAIEKLSTGDMILNHDNKPLPVLKTSHRKITWAENLSDDKRMFKIDGPEPIYLTGYHKVRLEDGTFQEAHNCYLPFAKKEEYLDENGDFEIYHLNVEDWSNNHLVVNGGKVVESWSGKYGTL